MTTCKCHNNRDVELKGTVPVEEEAPAVEAQGVEVVEEEDSDAL